jgi:hypothetical protein
VGQALAVHPLVGEKMSVVSPYGRHAVWVETSDGNLRLLPLAWTTLEPRGEPLALQGRALRLDPLALRELAAWVAARTPVCASCDGEEVATRIGESEKGVDERWAEVDGVLRRVEPACASVAGRSLP